MRQNKDDHDKYDKMVELLEETRKRKMKILHNGMIQTMVVVIALIHVSVLAEQRAFSQPESAFALSMYPVILSNDFLSITAVMKLLKSLGSPMVIFETSEMYSSLIPSQTERAI